MKDFTKYALLTAVLVIAPLCANAELSVKDTTSPEFIHNQGYSPEISRIIDVKTVDPLTPIPAEETGKNAKWKKFGWVLLETLDPSYSRDTDFVNHYTKFDKYRTDDL